VILREERVGERARVTANGRKPRVRRRLSRNQATQIRGLRSFACERQDFILYTFTVGTSLSLCIQCYSGMRAHVAVIVTPSNRRRDNDIGRRYAEDGDQSDLYPVFRYSGTAGLSGTAILVACLYEQQHNVLMRVSTRPLSVVRQKTQRCAHLNNVS